MVHYRQPFITVLGFCGLAAVLITITSTDEDMFSYRSVGLFVCLCAKISKSYEQILMKFFGDVSVRFWWQSSLPSAILLQFFTPPP